MSHENTIGIADAVVALGQEPSPERSDTPPTPDAAPDLEAPPAPETQELETAIDAAEGAEKDRQEWLHTEEARLQREESRTAFDDLAASEAATVIGNSFAERIQQLDLDPTRVLSDLQIEEVVGTYGALVSDGEGGSLLVESPIPVRTERPGEKAEPVDGDLADSEGGFVSETPATDIRLPSSLGESIDLGQGLAFAGLPGDGQVAATRYGDSDLFFANADTDTDTFVAPLTSSVEIFEQLRSPKSPERYRFDLSIPDGAKLRADDFGGAEIIDASGNRLAFVPAPYAVDAQGTAVPVSMSVEGDAVVIDIRHRSYDVAYPLLLDPELVLDSWTWGGGTAGLDKWGWSETADYENGTNCTLTCWGYGLYSRSKGSNYSYGANTYGEWSYTAPNITAYIAGATFLNIRGNVYNCSTYQPHGYVGLYNVYSGSWNNLGIWSPPSSSSPYYDTGWVGGNGTRKAIVGIATASASSQLACGHDFYVGGAMLYQDDPENPEGAVYGMPSGWIGGSPPFTLQINGHDPGLGVRKITFTRDGNPAIERPVGCNGTASSRCPIDRSEYFNVSGLSFDEGKKNATATVEDVTGKKWNSTWQTYVDRTKPNVTLSGQLAVATDEDEGEEKDPEKWDELSLPVYNLDIKATDIGTEANADYKKRSGVRKLEVQVDGVKKESWEQPCADSCSMEKSYSLKLNNLSAGKHILKVIATDGVSNAREREVEFEFIPATGMKDEYVTQYFPLPDGEGNEEEEENPDRPELAVNVINGNLVYREKDVEVNDAYGVPLEVERYYNSLLPDGENTEWGDGWTLAQTPELEPEAGPSPEEAMMVGSSGAVEGSVELPATVGSKEFDPQLQAVVTKEAGGGYEIEDATGETDTALAFDASGKVEEVRTEGEATLDYDYDGGELAEIAVDDPASTDVDPAQAAELAEMETAPRSFKYAFGLQGSADGQFKVATDIAIDPTDSTIWVADDENDRVQHFSAEGAYIGKFPSCFDPGAVDVDLQGDIYVACSSARKIQKFNDMGTLLKQIAGPGVGNGQIELALDLALDAEQNLYVADTDNARVQKFNAAGAFVKAMPVNGHPWGVDVAPDGDIWTAEAPERRVSVFDPQGNLLFRFGSQGSGHGQFERPVDVEVDGAGFAYVTDAVNNRVEVFNSEGSFVTQFGEKGTGNGQLNTDWWLRVAVGPGGDVWVTDQGNSRLHKWINPAYASSFKYAFGLQGSADGQFKVATDIAIDPTDSTIWVADDENDRVQHFSAEGAYLGKFASCSDPGAVDVDLQGDIYVACSSVDKIQKFNDKGTFLKQIAGTGAGNGQVRFPLDLALDAEQNLYVADTDNARVQKFNAAGAFVKSMPVGESGRPWGVDVAPDGKIWTTEPGQYRVSVFDPQGTLLFRFGSQGSGRGQFQRPVDVEVDESGFAYVTDAVSNRVEVFDSKGAYVTQFGEKGTGSGQLNTDWWLRLAVGPGGDVWVTDQGNSRLHKWKAAGRLRPGYGSKIQDDPEVEVESPGGLVASVEGEEAGVHVYGHSGELLTYHEDAKGKTTYVYDASKRLTKVTLPNGTWGEVKYGATDGRVSSVTVDPAGAPKAKTTSFTYKDQPRSTTVTLPEAPSVTYEIGEDGSVFKWQNAKVPPEFEDIAGTLYDVEGKETAAPIAIGDHNLIVQAYSEEGIASIQIYANGNEIVSEKTCVKGPGVDCKHLPDEWVTNTGEHAPGILYLEMVIQDYIGQVASKRFWVNIPYTPPPPPDQPATPKFADVSIFREEHGLDVDLDPVKDEFQINDRVFDTINDWIQGNPVAVASMERWGAPLRTPEVAELDSRLAYWPHDAHAIEAWGKSHASGSFAGAYMDERAGGIMRVGFTSEQETHIGELASSGGLTASSRVASFTAAPQHSLVELETLRSQIAAAAPGYPSGIVNRVGVNVPGNVVEVGSSNVAQAKSTLQSSFGAQAPLLVVEASAPLARAGRDRDSGPMLAGDRIYIKEPSGEEWECSAAFGAFDLAIKPGSGERVWRMFLLTAAHCAEEVPGSNIYRASVLNPLPSQRQTLGEVKRTGWDNSPATTELDIEAMRFKSSAIVPRQIYPSPGEHAIGVTGTGLVQVGTRVCYSGATTDEALPSGVKCGTVFKSEYFPLEDEHHHSHWGYEWCFDRRSIEGDSGSPVWIEGTGTAAGVLSSGTNTDTCFSPLQADPAHPEIQSALSDSRLAPLDGIATR